MGDPRKSRKKFDRPKVRYNKERIVEEKQLLTKYGLKNKKELWRAEKEVRRIRDQAKRLLTASEELQKEFIKRLFNQGLLQAETVDDVLELKSENILNRRLQTIVANKFKLKPKQSRQFIVHGHINVEGRRVNVPSFSVNLKIEQNILLSKK